MAARAAHYTGPDRDDRHQGVTKLHGGEREKLLEAADALLFEEPESARVAARTAEQLIESLETSERWTAEACDQLREHSTAARRRTRHPSDVRPLGRRGGQGLHVRWTILPEGEVVARGSASARVAPTLGATWSPRPWEA